MKRLSLLFIAALCLCIAGSNASICGLSQNIIGHQLHLGVSGEPYTNPTTGGNPHPRTPVLCPTISLDGHTLYLYNMGYDSTIQLLDDTETEVYVQYVPAGTSIVDLPSTLSGDYKLCVIPDDSSYYFYGWIEL